MAGMIRTAEKDPTNVKEQFDPKGLSLSHPEYVKIRLLVVVDDDWGGLIGSCRTPSCVYGIKPSGTVLRG